MTTTANYWNATAYATTPHVFVVKPRHVPGFLLTEEERERKSCLHKYGLCCRCDSGLDDRADFVVCNEDALCEDMMLLCNACEEYFENDTIDY
jgi:hypothetical protein